MLFKNPVFLVACGYFLFALQSVILDKKVAANYGQGVILVIIYLSAIPLLIGRYLVMRVSGEEFVWPPWEGVGWIALMGCCYFFGDLLLFKGYGEAAVSQRQYLHTLVLTAVAFPAFAALQSYVWSRNVPNKFHMAAFVVAILMVFLAKKGEEQQTAEAEAAAKAPSETTTK